MYSRIVCFFVGIALSCNMLCAQQESDANPAHIRRILDECKLTRNPEYYKAACFLVENMIHHNVGGRVLSYDHRIDSLIKESDALYYSLSQGHSGKELESNPLHAIIKRNINEAAKRAETIVYEEPVVEVGDSLDVEALDYDFLREHLDNAFRLRETVPSVRNLGFEDFCSYVLPYRAMSDYPLVCTGRQLNSIFSKYLLPYYQQGAQDLALGYNRTLWWLRKAQGKYPYDSMIGWPELFFKDNHDCVDLANYATLIFRSCGIPAAVESNIAQRFSTSRHFMTAFIDKDGQWQKFDPESSGIVDKKAPAVRALNIYREHFEVLPSTPFALRKEGEPLPDNLSDVGIEDVSELYMKPVSLSLHLDTVPSGRNLVYLATFMPHGQGLLPVTWGEVEGDSAKFLHVVKDEVYFPVWLDDEKKYHLCASPFLVEDEENSSARITQLLDIFCSNQTINDTISISRKYPRKPSFLKDATKTVGTYVVASDYSDFSVVDTVGIINYTPDDTWYQLPLSTARPYQYYRVQAPDSDPHLHLAEIQFYADGKPVYDEPKEKRQKKAEYDGKVNTAPDRWPHVTLSLQEPARVTRLRYIVKNSDNRVKPRHHYRLYELQEDGWQLLHEMDAKFDTLEFANLIDNHIYWLHDCNSHNNDELPFVIKGGVILNPYESIMIKYNL